MNKINVIIDCDTGIDDAVALVMANGLKDKLNILGVTTVAGNVGLKNTTKNTLNVLKLIGSGDVQVAKGASKALEREEFRASGVHGANGLRGYDFAENTTEAFVETPAWDFMYEKINSCDTKVTIIAIGPVTNVALLFRKYPEIKAKVEKIIFMGTSYHDGNPTPVSTFNVLVDPEAFRELLFSGVDIYSCPLETTRQAYITTEELLEIKAINNKTSELVYSVLTSYGVDKILDDEVFGEVDEEIITPERIAKEKALNKIDLHDPATIALAVSPELFTVNKYYCDVECKGELTTGFTLIDKNNYYMKSMSERNLYFAETIDREKFIELLKETIRKGQ